MVVYSLTQYIAGHSDVVMGAVVVNDKQFYEDTRFLHIGNAFYLRLRCNNCKLQFFYTLQTLQVEAFLRYMKKWAAAHTVLIFTRSNFGFHTKFFWNKTSEELSGWVTLSVPSLLKACFNPAVTFF